MENDHTPAEPEDEINQAFEDLRKEVSLTRHAVEGLTAARERIPDYSVTLAEMFDALKNAAGGIERIEAGPVARLTPAAFGAQIVKAATDARAQDRATLQLYRDTMSHSIGKLDGIVERGQTVSFRQRQLVYVAAAGFLLGILFWSIFPSVIARSLPASWHVPEWMAARTMGMKRREAGMRLVETSAPEASQPLPLPCADSLAAPDPAHSGSGYTSPQARRSKIRRIRELLLGWSAFALAVTIAVIHTTDWADASSTQ